MRQSDIYIGPGSRGIPVSVHAGITGGQDGKMRRDDIGCHLQMMDDGEDVCPTWKPEESQGNGAV